MLSSAPGRPWSVQRARSILLLGVPASSPLRVRLGIVLAMVIGAATVGASGAIHLHLWIVGYRHVHNIGPLFLAQSISGFALALLIVISRRMFAVLAGALFQATSVIGLVLSATVGFLGIHDGLGVPWATESIIVELIGFVLLAGCGFALVIRR
jgi:hypothetical protein